MEESLQQVTDAVMWLFWTMCYVTAGIWIAVVVGMGWYNALSRNPRKAR